MDMKQIAEQFANEYYQNLSNNKGNLINFFQDNSKVTNNGKLYAGMNEIKEYIQSLNFQNVNFKFDSLDFQEGPNTILIFVTGQMLLDQSNCMTISQVFQLASNGNNGFFILNNIVNIN